MEAGDQGPQHKRGGSFTAWTCNVTSPIAPVDRVKV